MSIRYISSEWEVKNVNPPEMEKDVKTEVSQQIDVNWLRDTTVNDELTEFATANNVSFTLEAVNDFGKVIINFPEDM